MMLQPFVTACAKGGSWHAYQQYKKQAEHIKALEAELAALRAGQAAKGDSNGSH